MLSVFDAKFRNANSYLWTDNGFRSHYKVRATKEEVWAGWAQ